VLPPPLASKQPARAHLASRGDQRRTRDLRAPSLFVSHAFPFASLDPEFRKALRQFGATLGQARGVIVASAGWQSLGPVRVTASRQPGTERPTVPGIDVGLYKLAGSPPLAEQVVAALKGKEIPALADMSKSFDPAAWLPLAQVYPGGQVPAVEISLPAASTPGAMLAIGRALAPLRREGILLVGSGGLVFNSNKICYQRARTAPEIWALAFDEWVRERLHRLDVEALAAYRTMPQAWLAAQAPEYLDPFFVVLGTQLPGDRVHPLFEGFHGGAMSMRSFALAGQRADDLRLPPALTAG
jgi:4,5-DOPA dioxygenase extradiol